MLRALLGGVLVALLAEVSINPFGTAFRFSLGPVGLAFFALFFMLPSYLTGTAAGIIVPIVHGLFALFRTPAADVLAAAGNYFPETVAYTVLGLLLFAFRVQSRTREPLQLAFYLAAADFGCNVVELFIRAEPFQLRGMIMTLLVAIGRAFVAEGAYYVVQVGVRERQWAEERLSYMRRLLFAANLQTEAFFLQKSAQEIEQIMAKAHRLYRDLAGRPEQPLALEIAKDIHEVKKDYQRTLVALYRLVDAPELEPEMNLSDVVRLVVDANKPYADTLGKQITFRKELRADFRTPRFGRWVSILNNLVSNGIEACGNEGKVTLRTVRTADHFVLWVSDTGAGIPAEDWELVFSPGFSTKLNPVTGAFSSGIGLTHVAGLVRGMGGTIRVERSDAQHGTTFRIEVPWSGLEAVAEEGGAAGVAISRADRG